jgi:hypothetical protein
VRGENAWRAVVPNFGKSGDDLSKKGGNLNLGLTLLAALEFKLDIVQAIQSYLIIVGNFHLWF